MVALDTGLLALLRDLTVPVQCTGEQSLPIGGIRSTDGFPALLRKWMNKDLEACFKGYERKPPRAAGPVNEKGMGSGSRAFIHVAIVQLLYCATFDLPRPMITSLRPQ